MKNLLHLLIVFIGLSVCPTSIVNAQGVGINSSGNAPDPSAILDVSSTTKGFVLPRMTTAQRNAINSPIEGLQIFNTTTKCFEFYVNGSWLTLSCGCNPPLSPAAGTNTPLATGIVWNWNTVSVATGYKYSSLNDYNSAIDNGVSTSYTQTGLTCGTSYTLYVWAYNNNCGNSSSTTLNQITSACFPNCGTQVWAPANLNVGTMINSTSSGSQQPPPYNYKYCYDNDPVNCDIYGGLYEWTDVMLGAASVNCDPCGPTTGHGGVQGMCPSGYHIPSDLEWSRYEYCLENNIAPTGNTTLATFQTTMGWRGSATAGAGAGDKMKVTSSNIPAWDGTNTSSFAALPAGFRSTLNGSGTNLGSRVYYWSATQNGTCCALGRQLETSSANSRRDYWDRPYGFSVRCLKD